MPASKPITPLTARQRTELDMLVRKHRVYLMRQARRLCGGSREVAEDLVQSTLYEVARDYPKFDRRRAAFATWATLLLFRKWGDMRVHYRRHQGREIALTDLMEECTGYAATGDVEREALSNLRCEEMMALASRLYASTPRTRARDRTILRLQMQGYSTAEIGARVHCSDGLVKLHLREMGKRLREMGRGW